VSPDQWAVRSAAVRQVELMRKLTWPRVAFYLIVLLASVVIGFAVHVSGA
jgi:hypothetical protein